VPAENAEVDDEEAVTGKGSDERGGVSAFLAPVGGNCEFDKLIAGGFSNKIPLLLVKYSNRTRKKMNQRELVLYLLT
jgi:hypothetical protein